MTGDGVTLRECRDCGEISRLPPIRPNFDARCPRCIRVLRRGRRDPLDRALACVLAGLFFFAVMISAPFMTVESLGRLRHSTLFTGPEMLEQYGYGALALIILLTTVLLPLLKLLILAVVLIGLRLSRPPAWLFQPLRWLEMLEPWAMVEVFLLGLFVAYTRLTGLVQVDIDVGAYALVGVMLSMVAADAALDHDTVWAALEKRGLTAKAAGERTFTVTQSVGLRTMGCQICRLVARAVPGESCRRCGAAVKPRQTESLVRSWALLIGATVLYIPANALPIMHMTRLGVPATYTILGGVGELIGAGLWPLALLVFVASILVPLTKLAGLFIMLIATHRGSAYYLFERTRAYRVLRVIGRWSMIDVFMISILVALVHFDQLARVTTDTGALCFAAVVILTMLATESFDPRLMWDRAGRRGAPPRALAANPSGQGSPA